MTCAAAVPGDETEGNRMIENGTPASHLTGVRWRKPRFSQGNSNCAELARLGEGQVAIRQNTDPAGPALIMSRAEFAGFVAEAKRGGLDDLLLPA